MRRSRSTLPGLLGSALLAVALLVRREHSLPSRPPQAADAPEQARRADSAPRATPHDTSGASVSEPAQSQASHAELAAARPHPITVEHLRNRRERQLLAALDQAMQLRDAATFNASLATYRSEFPDEDKLLQHCYALIGACLVAPNDSNRKAARDFYRTHRGSTLRRWLRQICVTD